MKTVIDKIVAKIEKLRPKDSSQVKFWVSLQTYTDIINEFTELETANKKKGEAFWGRSAVVSIDIPDSILSEAGVKFKVQTLRTNLQLGHFGDILTSYGYVPIYVGKEIPDSAVFLERVRPVIESLSKNPQDLHSI